MADLKSADVLTSEGAAWHPRDAAREHLLEHARLRNNWVHWKQSTGTHPGLPDFHRSARLPGNITPNKGK